MVIWADPAKSDLRAIHDFIASDSKYYAKKVVQDIVDRTNILEEYPRIGRKAPEIGDANIRGLGDRFQICPPGEGIRHRDHSRQTGFYIHPCVQSQRTLIDPPPQNAKFKDLTPKVRRGKTFHPSLTSK